MDHLSGEGKMKYIFENIYNKANINRAWIDKEPKRILNGKQEGSRGRESLKSKWVDGVSFKDTRKEKNIEKTRGKSKET